jgi:hypothetical protein
VSVGTNIPPASGGSGISKKPPAATVLPNLEDPRLATALASLNAAAKAKGDGTEVWRAISAQARVSPKTLQQQRATTNMNHGELLVANSLAASSGKSFTNIVSLRAKAGTWSQLARTLRVEPATLAARAAAADAALRKAGARTS